MRHRPPNVRFRYLYRDASNWKAFGEVVFGGHPTLPVWEAESLIRQACEDGCYFIAGQVGIAEVFLWLAWDLDQDDHCWHEFEGLAETQDPVSDPAGRDIRQLVMAFRQAARQGWQVFEPAERW